MTTTHVRMGTRALGLDDWLRRDDLTASELALRRRLLAEQRQHVFACNEAALDAALETSELVEAWHDGPGLPRDGSEEPHPLARAAATIQEDLCLMVRQGATWRLEAGCVCFPSLWSLAEKLGQPTAVVHGPVAHYQDELATRVDTFFDRLSTDKPVWRRNLSLWPACLLWAPTVELHRDLWDPVPKQAGAPRLWLRSERQTLRRLPVTGAILFTIGVQMAPLSILATRPDRARDLAAWLRGAGGESRRRQLGPLLEPDLAWLDRIAAAADGDGAPIS